MSPSPSASRLRPLLLICVAALVILGAMEAFARRTPPDERTQMVWDYLSRLDGFETPCPEVAALPPRRGPKTRRIAVVGESNGAYFADVLRDLATGCDSLDWQVVNCAVPAAGPRETTAQLRALERADVDDVVVVFGNNAGAYYPSSSWLRSALQIVLRSRLIADTVLARGLLHSEIAPSGLLRPLWIDLIVALTDLHLIHRLHVIAPTYNP